MVALLKVSANAKLNASYIPAIYIAGPPPYVPAISGRMRRSLTRKFSKTCAPKLKGWFKPSSNPWDC
ncbi:protein of unknown function [Methylocella tundrae]|uniref:Uncharacterized protein n=1 Tax=Methylocella tundrae TaxID=227605 RepID=A0A4U8Z0J0_METTU|nr:protein of unknown function [Methylocella tundrae]